MMNRLRWSILAVVMVAATGCHTINPMAPDGVQSSQISNRGHKVYARCIQRQMNRNLDLSSRLQRHERMTQIVSKQDGLPFAMIDVHKRVRRGSFADLRLASSSAFDARMIESIEGYMWRCAARNRMRGIG